MASVNAAKATNFGPNLVQAAGFIGSQFLTQGQHWFVRPGTGSDDHDGKTLASAFQTLPKAQAAATANQNDVVFLVAESNSAGSTTARVSTALAVALDWAKDLVHLVGLNAGGAIGQRSRIAFDSDFVTATNLFTLSANGCLISGIHFFAGVSDANPTGCLLVTGERNVIENCHIAGIGNAANDIAGAYSVKLTGDENLFKDVTIGLDTIARGTNVNSGLLVDGGAARNIFDRCLFIAFLEHATNHVHVRFNDTTAIDRFLLFRDCIFDYESTNFTAAGTGVMLVPALSQGRIIVFNSMAFSDAPGTVVKWDVNDNNKIYIHGSPTPAADTVGVARVV